MKMRVGPSLGSAFAVTLIAASAFAVVCNVPSGTHPAIQDAVDDLACTEVVLAAQTFVESVAVDRSLELRGASSTTTIIEGRILVEGASTQVVVQDLKVDGSATSVAGCFPEALAAQGGAEVSANGVLVVNADGDACLLFGDGFESGDTDAWSSTLP